MKHRTAWALWVLCFGLSIQAAPRPNILLILADDLGYGDLGSQGQKRIQTPHLDRMAAEGIRFTQAYAGGPVCTSSRCVLVTGRHNGHTVARDNVPHFQTYLHEEDVTFAEVLSEAGYVCHGVGKWSLGDAGTEGAATRQGFQSWFGFLNQDHAHHYFTEYLDDDEGRLDLRGNSMAHGVYSQDLLTQKAMEVLTKASRDEKPFLLYLAYTTPHFSARSEDPDGFAVPSLGPYSDREWDDKSRKYAAMVDRLDRDVGRLLQELDQLGLAKDTLVIFSSDNGGHRINGPFFQSSGPLRGYKRDLTEGGIRVPFLARWPGKIPEGRTSGEIIGFQDLLPTFAELAEAPVPDGLDGLSIVEALEGRPLSNPHDWLYWDYGHRRNRFDQAVRMDRWKGIRLGKASPLELYDLEKDLGETRNLASQFPDVVARLEEIMNDAYQPHPRYPIGKLYWGGAIWKPETGHPEPVPPDVAQVGDSAIIDSGFVFPPESRPTPTCHASTVVELASGQLAAAWFGGTTEPDIDNVIWFSRKESSGWTRPLQVVDGTEGETRDHRVGNPVLYQSPKGPLMLFYKVVDPEIGRASSWWGMLSTSLDEGRTWSQPRRLGQDQRLGARNPNLIGPSKNKPVQLADGSLLSPSSTEHEGWRLHFERSTDGGRTWEVIGPVDPGEGLSAIQPSILFLDDGTLQVVCRSREGMLTASRSSDGGRTWSPLERTHLPNPNSGTDAVTLQDGRHLLVYNHTRSKGPFPSGRNLLNVALSRDGFSWKPILTLEKDRGEFSYPAVIQSRDGRVHITYTWRRQSIRHLILDPSKL